VARDRYDAVLGLLVLGYLLSAISVAGLGRVLTGAVYLGALVVAWASSVLRRLRGQLAAAALLVLALPVAVARLSGAGQTADVLGSLWLSLVLLLTLVTIVGRILQHDEVSLQTLFGALSAYLMIGLIFASWYAALQTIGNGTLFAGTRDANGKTLQYFSFITLTTTGYGDFVPATDIARAVAVLEALIGQIFLATLVARLVSSFAGRRRRT
jgi:hypothetical protein